MAKKKKVVKKAPARKPVKKVSKKVAKKTAKKVAAKKTTKKVTKKVTKKIVKKPVKKSISVKTVKKSAPEKAPSIKSSSVDYSKAITPLADRLVIRAVVSKEKTTPAGLILTDAASNSDGYIKGTVLAAGHGSVSKKGRLQQLDVKVGDVVLFSDYVSTKVNFNNEDLHIVHESDILGIIE